MILDQQTYDRLNTIEATLLELRKAVTTLEIMFLERVIFPQVTVDPIEVAEPQEAVVTVEANAGKDKTNGPSKEKPKAKKKTVRKTS